MVLINSVCASEVSGYNQVLTTPITVACMKERVAGVLNPQHDNIVSETTISPLHHNQNICASSGREDYMLVGQIPATQANLIVDSKWTQSYSLSQSEENMPNHAIAVLPASSLRCKGDSKLCGINVWPASTSDANGLILNINT
jgi:hypothetical protein